MNVYYNNRKLERVFNSNRECVQRFGPEITKKIQQRLFELKAANTLKDISYLPSARCHELTGKRAGQFAVDLKHPYRLVFKPENPVPRKNDGGIDWGQVTSVIILEVVNYHD